MADKVEKIKVFLLDKTVQEAETARESEEYIHVETCTCSIREVCVDGVQQRTTKDFRDNRANVHTVNGKITDVVGFY
ncbi:MAG: hypothetical protein Terrestrivirus5_59 [Terrestrivirus sp.]|uniref:Uncharacterized protein n=1 Tax=Terrestrivirus sp. TaxID=2487775 RepID=A0A3G4ZN05_9VIRU|nr:MAG: hypothetical protein Terrestrivirus5_59 [Terrestrivirus sp.]